MIRVVFLAAAAVLGATATQPPSLEELSQATRWGEPSRALAAQFAASATVLPQPIDFGDSYSDVVLHDVAVGGVRLIAFFQMDKATGGLKRVQLERPRHGVNPPAARALFAALAADYGAPQRACDMAPVFANGYQASAERMWRHDGVAITLILRDTTLEAVEGCLGDGGALRVCGLTGQLLVRISPPAVTTAACTP